MSTRRALLISLGLSLLLTGMLWTFFGPRALGILLFFPLGAMLLKQRDRKLDSDDQEPIEPY